MLVLLFCAVRVPRPLQLLQAAKWPSYCFFSLLQPLSAGPWQQPLHYLSSQNTPRTGHFGWFSLFWCVLMIILARLLQKLLRYDALKSASSSSQYHPSHVYGASLPPIKSAAFDRHPLSLLHRIIHNEHLPFRAAARLP